MASTSIGSVYAELTLQDKMGGGIASAQKSLKSLEQSVGRMGMVMKGIGLYKVGEALFEGVKGAFSAIDELDELSAASGIAVSSLMKLGQAYSNNGREAGKVGGDIAKMQKAITVASEGGKDPFAKLALTAQELQSMKPEDQFRTIGQAILRLATPAERAAKSMEIFGKSGAELVTVFGGLDEAVAQLGEMPGLAEEYAARIGEANDIIDRFGMKKDQFFTGFAAGIVDTILPGLRELDDYQFTMAGFNFAQSLIGGLKMVVNSDFWDELNSKLTAGLYKKAAPVAGVGAVLAKNFSLSPGAMIANEVASRVAGRGSAIGADYQSGVAKSQSISEEWATKANAAQARLDKMFMANAIARAQYEKDLKARMELAKYPNILQKVEEFDTGVEKKTKKSKHETAAKFVDAVIPDDPMAFANEYMKRGLSLGGGGAAAGPTKVEQKLEESIVVQRSMRDGLKAVEKAIEEGGRPVPATF